MFIVFDCFILIKNHFFFYGNKNSNWFQITLITKMLIQYYQEVLKKENSSIWNSKDLES